MRPICDRCLRPALVFVKRSSAVDPGKFFCSRHLETSFVRADQFTVITSQNFLPLLKESGIAK